MLDGNLADEPVSASLTTPIKNLGNNIWTAERSFRVFGMDPGNRMTVMRLDDGQLVLHSPVKFDESLHNELTQLGQPSYIIAPNRFHHLWVADYVNAFPEIRVLMAPGLKRKRADLPCYGELPEDVPGAWQGKIACLLFEGAPVFNEVLVYHPQSKTLILTDLAANFHATTQGRVLHFYLRFVNNAFGRFATPRIMKWATRDKTAAQRSIERVLQWDFERIVVSHGEILEQDAKAEFRKALHWVLST